MLILLGKIAGLTMQNKIYALNKQVRHFQIIPYRAKNIIFNSAYF